MKRWVLIAAVVVVAGVATAYMTLRRNGDAPSYRFVTVERGNIDAVVSATGTLSAVTTVQVGTQVSGLISELLVDFNDRVEKGQVIARLDTTLLESNLRDVEASLERSRAEVKQAERDYERVSSLYQQGISAVADFNKAQYNRDVARAQVKSAEASLARAQQNLAYATITAPVSGIVVERAVDVGQTVAASLSAPKLFTIANDLSEMQILAPVDESDIGQIKEGQLVRFTVKTYPDRRFEGVVKQVRLQSTIEQNIVSYTVVIAVANLDGKLLPGMTATAEFVVASAENVLKVSNAALRFRPPEVLAAEARARFQKEMAARRTAQGESAPGQRPEGAGVDPAPGRPSGDERGSGFPGAPGNGSRNGRDFPALYYIATDGNLALLPVRPGITDGQSTEVRGRQLEAGMQVIAGMTQGVQKASTNPFQSTQSNRPPRPPGMF
ncbi:MAG: efflux RND transporter periplasmic adaptor subunit [Thermoanaerobaculaceae bacterium]|nr:efflux RND transporter periplasmic adaptor subunit [Thermoanaerobaculaceae bacterium]MDI9622085.1 efflux RND transporter periplasmic adaptor subunit [Acidobacteriota bacterium]NLH11562.1 efflux RND transporter periplasmic adaptor subunit [Holophagae bacterium]HPW54572.1 efflux RND transporter periplasmic adaptor subunit [Thermoanaerobaculaceae bacterium]